MSRCKACDCILHRRELRRSKPDQTTEDLCNTCRHVAYYPDSVETRDYVCGNITENPVHDVVTNTRFSDESS